MIGSVCMFLIPLFILSITFNYIPKADHHFQVKLILYKKLSNSRVQPPLIILLFWGCLTMLLAVGVVKFYEPLTFIFAGLSIQVAICTIQTGTNLASMCFPKAFGRRYLLCVAATIKMIFEITILSSYSIQVNNISKILIPLAKNLSIYWEWLGVHSLRATNMTNWLDNDRSLLSYKKSIWKIVMESKCYRENQHGTGRLWLFVALLLVLAHIVGQAI